MEAAYPNAYQPLLPLTTLQRAYECVSRGICEPLDTLVEGWVYNLVMTADAIMTSLWC